ncbi:MAG: DUF58 domain-containing protein [Rhodospirillaceae bacterium]|nr:DUF58 domain-containing protein [Rhodospirillaceae bacterium]
MHPTRLAVLVAAMTVPVAILFILAHEGLWPAGLVAAGMVLAAMVWDGLSTLPAARLRYTLTAPEVLFIGSRAQLTVAFAGTGWPRPTRLELVCDFGPNIGPAARAPVRVLLDDGAAVHIPLVPDRRGTVELQRIWMRWLGPLGLVWRQRVYPVDRTFPVVPDIHAVRAAAIPFVVKDAYFGIKVRRELGGGTEFDSLRDYLPGLDHRAIDWKHSARHCKLICKEFQAERNHNVVLAFDTGHLMREPLDGIPRLDHAINAGLLLAYLALRTGDRVGLFAFDARVRLMSAPTGGVGGMPRLLEATSRLDYHLEETNFTLGLAELNARLRRRALVVLFTEFVDTVTAELMVENVARLANRHLVIFVTLQDRTVSDTIDAQPRGIADLARTVVAADLARERMVVLEKVRRLGVHTLEVPAASLAVGLVSRYLTVRRMELV